MLNFEKIKVDCYGCTSCVHQCPVGIIQMISDEWGFSYPTISQSDRCIGCDRCVKSCPLSKELPLNSYLQVEAMRSDEEASMSTSGGIVGTLAKQMIKEGGVVYGVSMNDARCKFVRIEKLDQLKVLRGSKYVQAEMENIFLHVKKDLKSGIKVLFIGTPCQVAGLYSFLPECYIGGLLSVSFVCGGVPSHRFLTDALSRYTEELEGVSVNFRQGQQYLFQILREGNEIKKIRRTKSSYMLGFDARLTLRNSCYHCKFSQPLRVGDITVGDFWGLGKSSFTELEKADGVSLVISTTEKGLTWLDRCRPYLRTEKRTWEEAIRWNARLAQPTPAQTVKVEKFRKRYLKVGFHKAVKRSLTLRDNIKEFLHYSKVHDKYKEFILYCRSCVGNRRCL